MHVTGKGEEIQEEERAVRVNGIGKMEAEISFFMCTSSIDPQTNAHLIRVE